MAAFRARVYPMGKVRQFMGDYFLHNVVRHPGIAKEAADADAGSRARIFTVNEAD